MIWAVASILIFPPLIGWIYGGHLADPFPKVEDEK